MTTPSITITPNYYPRLKALVDTLTEDQRTAFKVWIQLPKGLGCSYGKAYEISKGIFKGSVAERRAIADYLQQYDETLTEEILFYQTQKLEV